MKKQYKIGDRVFFEDYLGKTIGTATIKRIENKSYLDRGKKIYYQEFITLDKGNYMETIEDYNCLPLSDPRCKELIKVYKKFDKDYSKIVQSIVDILLLYNNICEESLDDLFTIVKSKLNK